MHIIWNKRNLIRFVMWKLFLQHWILENEFISNEANNISVINEKSNDNNLNVLTYAMLLSKVSFNYFSNLIISNTIMCSRP